MNDPDDLYHTTRCELVKGQKFRTAEDGNWITRSGCPSVIPKAFVQAQRWIEPEPEPVMVTVPAEQLREALTAWSHFGVRHDFAADDVLYHRHRESLWEAIYDAEIEARS